MSSDEDFFLSVAVKIGNNRRGKTVGLVFDWIIVGQMEPCLSKREVSFVLYIKTKNWCKLELEIAITEKIWGVRV